jgi:DinB superfamily
MSPEHEAAIARIRSSAAALRAAVQAVPAGKEMQQPLPGEWSVQETLVHVRNVALLVLGLRIRRLLYERNPVFADYDDGPVRQANLGQPEPIDEVLDMIVSEHEQIARLVRSLPDADWQREGRHPERGSMSIEFLVRWAGEHAEEHAAQIAKTTAQLGRPSR